MTSSNSNASSNNGPRTNQTERDSYKTHFLAPHKVKLRRKEGRFMLKMDGQCIVLGEVRRARPLDAPDEYIVLEDDRGNELGVLRRIEDLEEESRVLLHEHLTARYQTTRISRILEVERDPISGLIHWRVEVERDEEEPTPEPEIAAPRREWKIVPRALRRREEDEFREGEFSSGREERFSIAVAEDVQSARYPRIFITDIEGKRYEIPSCYDLDLASRRAAEKYI